jgi:phosphoribosylaminoimidazole-succinocarboxamide synthase
MNRKPYFNTLPLKHQGKVRDTFEIPGHPDLLLMVATDAVSTHNVAHVSLIPGKGQILTAMSVFWALGPLHRIPTHILAYGRDIYNNLPEGEYPTDLHLRALVVRKLYMAPFELIYRRRMAGSLWGDYYKKGLPNPYGIDLPEGLELMSPLFPSVFTPTEKSATDDPVNGDIVRILLSPGVIGLACEVYERGYDFALSKGIEIIDFKAEVGIDSSGQIRLGDEWLTGDCCRFVETDKIVVGQEPPWADKQIVRDAAVELWGGKKSGPPLEFPEDVIQKCSSAYRNVFERITGNTLEGFQSQYF